MDSRPAGVGSRISDGLSELIRRSLQSGDTRSTYFNDDSLGNRAWVELAGVFLAPSFANEFDLDVD